MTKTISEFNKTLPQPTTKKRKDTGTFHLDNVEYDLDINHEMLEAIQEQEMLYRNRIINELRVLKTLDHPNIVKLYEYFEDEKKIYALFEKCGNNLFEEIMLTEFRTDRCAVYLRQILEVVKYLEDNNVCHLNIKPENILIESNLNIKVCGFGSSIKLAWMKKKGGTIFPLIDKTIYDPYCVAPELLQIIQNKKRQRGDSLDLEEEKAIEKNIETSSSQADVWSCGCILYNMLTGVPPFFNENMNELISDITKGNYKLDTPECYFLNKEAKDLIIKMLEVDPTKRITPTDALHHPFIKDMPQDYQVIGEKLKVQAGKTYELMKKFKLTQELQVAVYQYIVSKVLKKSERAEYGKVFKILDKDGDGTLTPQELRTGFDKHFDICISKDEIDEIMNVIDLNQNGLIEFSEFLILAQSGDKSIDKKLAFVFDAFDKDGDGLISPEELMESLGLKDIENVTKMIGEANKNVKVIFFHS